MKIASLKPSDFTLTSKETYFHAFNERSNSRDGVEFTNHSYRARCNVLGRNITVLFSVDNPVGEIDSYLPEIKSLLQWADDNKSVIYSTLVKYRSETWFDSDETRKMDNKKFMSFLRIEGAYLYTNPVFAPVLNMELLFNELDFCPGTHFTFTTDVTHQKPGAYHRNNPIA